MLKNFFDSLNTHAPLVSSIVALSLTRFDVLSNVLHMACTESAEIVDLPRDALHAHQDKVVCVFSPIDPYTPLAHHCHQLAQSYPGISTHITSNTTPHAFVLSHSDQVAQLCVSLLPEF